MLLGQYGSSENVASSSDGYRILKVQILSQKRGLEGSNVSGERTTHVLIDKDVEPRGRDSIHMHPISTTIAFII